ncbi:MAG: hypothetical protein AB7R89_03910 [Dehalococcoidia bacterium]
MADQAWSFVLRSLIAIGGFERGLFYDVPRDEAPRSRWGTRVFIQGSAGWRRYLASRRHLDDGVLTLLLALRRLDDDERRLAVDWGCRFANAFLLVEPHDASCDLTDPNNGARRRLQAIAQPLISTRRPGQDRDGAWMRDTALAAALRPLFGAWISWPEPFTNIPVDVVPLRLEGPDDTLHRRLFDAMAWRYPQACYDDAIESLYERERELFGGTVARIRTPFLTRLGMPVLFDPHRVDRAVRRLVNEGRASAFDDGPDPAFYRGPQRPLPERMTDAEIERLVMR